MIFSFSSETLPPLLLGIDLEAMHEHELLEAITTWGAMISRLDQETGYAKEIALFTRLRRSLAYSKREAWTEALQDLHQVFLEAPVESNEYLCAHSLLDHFFAIKGWELSSIAFWGQMIQTIQTRTFPIPTSQEQAPASRSPVLLGRLYHHRAQVYAQHDCHLDCRKNCIRAIQYQPDWSEPYALRGMVEGLMEGGERQQALADLSHAIRLGLAALLDAEGILVQYRQKQLASYYDWRGVLYTLCDQEPEALADFATGLSLDPTNEALARHRAVVRAGMIKRTGIDPANAALAQTPELLSPRVSARCRLVTERRTHQLSFDATAWFAQASIDELVALQQEGYQGQDTAGSIAEYSAETNLKLHLLLRLHQEWVGEQDTIRLTCEVKQDEAEAWMQRHCPYLLRHQPEEH